MQIQIENRWITKKEASDWGFCPMCVQGDKKNNCKALHLFPDDPPENYCKAKKETRQKWTAELIGKTPSQNMSK